MKEPRNRSSVCAGLTIAALAWVSCSTTPTVDRDDDDASKPQAPSVRAPAVETEAPKPDATAAKPIKVFILAGDENCLEQAPIKGRTDGVHAQLLARQSRACVVAGPIAPHRPRDS